METWTYRGVIEGFYGPMWSHEERLDLLQRLPGWHMNLYIYSPRDDPYHRLRWEAPYPAGEKARFAELAAEAARQGVGFSYALSPGNTFRPNDPAHRRALVDKLQFFIDLGCTFFPIFYDDLTRPFDPESDEGERRADEQVGLMNDLAAALTARCPGAVLLFCPTQYMTADRSRYLVRLHARLDPRIETVVTGVDPGCDGIVPTRFSDEGASRYRGNFGRRPFFWDNFNVRDNSLNTLHWSPYAGRGANLDRLCSGLVLNPQNVYLLNLPVLGCAGDYLADPRAYDPEASMRRHLLAFMGEEGLPFGLALSRWFTNEWFAGPGSGFVSAEANLPADLDRAAIRASLAPLCDFKDRFNGALMPPRVAAALVPYANLLTEYARAMIDFCETGEGGRLLERVDRPETECFRLPASLIRYARRLAGRTT